MPDETNDSLELAAETSPESSDGAVVAGEIAALAGRRSYDRNAIKRLGQAVLHASAAADKAARTGRETAQDVGVILGHIETQNKALDTIVVHQAQAYQRLESIDQRVGSLDARVAIQNGRMTANEQRVADIQSNLAYTDGSLALPKGIARLASRQMLGPITSLLLGALAGANAGAIVAAVQGLLGGS